MRFAVTRTQISASSGDQAGFGQAEMLDVALPEGKLIPSGDVLQVLNPFSGPIRMGHRVLIDMVSGDWFITGVNCEEPKRVP